MDIVINAAIQSPLFRNLSHIPADRLAFSHHITSNAPPLSKTKITVMPATMHNSLDADYQFRVPQFGFLNKVVIRLEYDIMPITRFQVTPLLPLYHIIQEISLRTHHKPIQTIYGKEMLVKHAYFSEHSDKGVKFLGTLNPPARPGVVDLGEMFKDSSGKPYDPIADVSKAATAKRRVTMMVEVPLASTEAPHVNFDTRFVEHLDLYVKLVSTNGGDVPIGMAAGLMEQDLSQDFNANPNATAYNEVSAKPFSHVVFSGVAAGSGGAWTTIPAGKYHPSASDDTFEGDGTGTTLPTNLIGKVYDNQPAAVYTKGTWLSIATSSSGASTLKVGTVNKSTGAITWTADNASAVTAGSEDDQGFLFVGFALAESAVTHLDDFRPTSLDTYAARAAVTLDDDGSAHTATLNRCTVTDTGGAGAFARHNILNFKRGGKTASASADNGPSIAPVHGDLNAIGTPSYPLCAMNWVRLGCADYSTADYKGWGKSAAATVYDTFSTSTTANSNLDWEDDARTVASNAAVGFAEPSSAIDPLARAVGESTEGAVISRFETGGATTVGQRDVQAALERYYTLYPHLNEKVCVANKEPSLANGCLDVTANVPTDASLADLTFPALLGGRATGAASFTAGADSHPTATPLNIGLSLSCTFLNYHDKIREDIATENFKDNAPATILQYDTQQEIVNAKYGESGSSYALNPYDEMVVHLKSNHLAYAISILAFRNKTPQELSGATARDAAGRSISLSDGPINDFGCVTSGGTDHSDLPNCRFPAYQVVENFKTVKPTYVAVKGSGRPIYECGIDATPTATGLNAQFCSKGSSGRIPGAGNCLAEGDLDNLSYNYNRTEGYGSLQGPETVVSDFLSGTDRRITGELADHCSAHVISWGLNTTDQLANSGSLALQTINQPTLHLRFPEKCRVYVYVHHFSMIQIDANTGSISKSLDV